MRLSRKGSTGMPRNSWGYESTTKNPQEAPRIYGQAADLGFSDAYIRIGELQEHGKGTGQNPSEALRSYQTAARAGNYLAYVFIARLLSCTEHFPRAEPSANRNMTGLLRKGPDFDGRPHPFGNARTAFAEPPDESDDALTNDRYTARA